METLPDAVGDRVVKELPLPPQKPISHDALFPTSLKKGSQEIPDWNLLKDHLVREEKEANVVKITGPSVLVGDIHGQFYDLVNLIEKAGDPRTLNYVFLGDYVDRGVYSLECLMLLFSIKMNYPRKFILLRGNHESRGVTEHFTFRQEVINKFDDEIYDLITLAFDTLPLAAVVNGTYLCMHGGISPLMNTIEDLNKVDRFQEIPEQGILCDILWSDPIQDELASKFDFQENPERACSFKYGLKPTKRILEQSDFTLLVRAHQVQMQGYKMHTWDQSQDIPTVITIFSAPNYCDCYNNKAAIIKIDGENFGIKNFEEVPHPYHLAGGLNLFEFSMPYLSEKILDMLYNILEQGAEPEELEEINDEDFNSNIAQLMIGASDAQVMRTKINSISRMRRMYKNLIENQDVLLQIKMANDGRIPRGLLLAGRPAIRNALKNFELAQSLDKENEKRPMPKSKLVPKE
ncbi:serine threonine-protein phosphatase [Stylonychia lemnae]|uniref:Serine/threonine-protein phosphatase n=1 Tax=Stylonychia lemnae TaxID=5949 RepID=A0A077ZUY6_STYLE|nr:serine threonine-protein phosphatase [Stylonychia lemnae]|eukprot:CDW72256.1 serine threonine-protein phosphatase [Stylonychia lemnae]